ncbi:FecR domain-containing protein [uncultured Algimonas sp.]|uniref:FecR family protein n=1 Tax=uncultured Algimonas sp. TaxID=1547920 RepID=UPI00261F6F59|nr:FecR domain-containing protein [uncultured Algimonas sp.]
MTVSDFIDPRPDFPEGDVDAQAAYWAAVLGSDRCRPAQRKSFILWREASAQNRAAYDTLIATLEASDGVRNDPDILALRAGALGQGVNARRGTRNGLRYGLAGIAASALFVIGLGGYQAGWIPAFGSGPVMQTASADNAAPIHLLTSVGERLTRTLPDGSTVEVNTDSEIRVVLADQAREIYMLRGQAIFDVAHDADRPFMVYAGDRKVTALGTLFEVRLDEASTQVTLLEGKVRVDEISLNDPDVAPIASAPVELSPGERFVSAEEAMTQVTPQTIESDLSWRQGRHIFVDAQLSHIVSELNRYTTRQIVLNDPAIGELEASANFKLGSTHSLAAALEANFGLSVTDDPDRDHIIIDW